MLPKTYMLGAPSDLFNTFGAPMSAHDLMKGLRMCNANLYAPMPDAFDTWFPGKSAGMTALWLGQPNAEGSKKICAFHLGVIPEFTQVAPGGDIIRRGWRAVLSKVIASRAATKRTVERVFKVQMDADGRDPLCSGCRADGKRNRANGKDGLCDLHANVQSAGRSALEAKKESRWLASLSPEKRLEQTVGRGVTTSRVMLDIGSKQSPTRAALPKASRQAPSRSTSTRASIASR